MLKVPRLKKQFIKEKERFCLGLDIGTHSIKAVKLKFIDDSVELCDFQVKNDLKEIAAASDIKKVNIALSGPNTVLRYVTFPKMNETELKQALRFEAQKYIPFPVQDLYLENFILNPDLPENKMAVLLAGVKKEFLDQRLNLVQAEGLEVNLVDIESLALINTFTFNYKDDQGLKGKTIAIIDIGASFTKLNIIDNGFPRLSRDINIAGNNFTQKIADTLTIDTRVAEAIKHNPAKEKLETVSGAVEIASANLISEIRTSFDYYESQSASSVKEIFLSGGSINCGVLKEILAKGLGITNQIWEPFKEIRVIDDALKARIKDSSAELATAVGLALRG